MSFSTGCTAELHRLTNDLARLAQHSRKDEPPEFGQPGIGEVQKRLAFARARLDALSESLSLHRECHGR